MNAFKVSLLLGSKTMDIWPVVFTRICILSQGLSAENLLNLRVGMANLKPDKLLNVFEHIGNETRQFSILLLIFSEQKIPPNTRKFFILTQ